MLSRVESGDDWGEIEFLRAKLAFGEPSSGCPSLVLVGLYLPQSPFVWWLIFAGLATSCCYRLY